MTEPRLSRINCLFLIAKIIFAGLALVCFATVSVQAQNVPSAILPNQQVLFVKLPSLTAPLTNPSAVLATSLETIIQDKDVCCGKGLALKTLCSPLRRP